MHILAWILGYLALSFVVALGAGKVLARSSENYPEAVPAPVVVKEGKGRSFLKERTKELLSV